MKEYIEIDLMKYLPLDSYVTLDDEFRIKLFNKAKRKFGTYAKMASKLKENPKSLRHRKSGRRSTLSKILRYLQFTNIQKTELVDNILDITAYFRAGAISINGLKIILNEEFAEFLGLLKGDGTITDTYISCVNTCVEIPLFFTNVVERTFGLKKNKIKISLLVSHKELITEANHILQTLKKRGYFNINIRKKHSYRGKKTILDFSVDSAVLARTFKNIMKDLYHLLENSPNSVKSAYVSGFASAEGCVHHFGGVRSVELYQKDINELEFIKQLLKDLNIFCSIHPSSDCFRIIISGRRNLEKFSRIVGFGRHKIRNKKLCEALDSYTNQVYKPSNERYNEILKVLNKNKTATVREISDSIGLCIRRTRRILADMLNKHLVKLDINKFPRKFYLGD